MGRCSNCYESQSALKESKVEIRIQFKEVAKGMFNDIQRNELVMRIQPNEAVYMKINSKIPGFLLFLLLPTWI